MVAPRLIVESFSNAHDAKGAIKQLPVQW